ncbi:MAG: N-acetylmuramoyl-L-alanine amidase [Clostridiales Family XIII bacterium]|jgi:N-acetylmuramoyl-L-alanine amidase|nr:N-acetylmuramoyl-L-alanine amidase [Clostridiales Family XIII bacterium]
MISLKQTARIALCFVCVLSAFLFSAAAPAIGTSTFAANAAPAESGEAEVLPPVTLRIDEQFISTDVTPVIIEGRTLVPARAVFESLGGTVSWDDSAYPVQLVAVSCHDIIVNLTIGAATAFVNGAETRLDVPAQLVNDRTLIPVRFVSESLGFVVRWDEAERIVDIYSRDYDIPPVQAVIENVDVTISDAGTRVSLLFTEPAPAQLTDPNPPTPQRFSVGFPHTSLLAPLSALEWQREISILRGVLTESEQTPTEEIPAGRDAAQGEPVPPQIEPPEAQTEQQAVPREASELWLTFELLEDAAPSLSSSEDGRTIYLDFPKPQTPFNPWADGKLSVILDPGHGAETVGKRSPDGSVLEYAFNRDMAARVKALLERHGVETLLTVTDDTDLSLEDRCKVANASGADLFVSLHANADGSGKNWTNPSGWEIFVYKKGSFSEQLANAIHSETMPASGLIDRGVKTASYYVIRNVNMPAALIEHGFYTNQTEIELLKSPEFRERLAVMDAKGILRFLGVAWSDAADGTVPTI